VFEYFQEDAAARARRACAAPLVALVLVEGYFTLEPIIRPVPVALVWLVELIAFGGAAWGFFSLGRFLALSWRELSFRVSAWLILALILTLFVGDVFLSMTFPWL
jgi:hypothetical protein